MKITVCVPAYNEAQIIEQTLKTIADFCHSQPKHQWKIVLADNGSTDDTIRLAKHVPNVSILEVTTRGKGAAIVAAAKQCDTDIFCFIDADLSASPQSLKELIESIENGNDVAIGSRLLDNTKLKRSFLRTLSSRLFNFFRQIILGIDVVDSQCGLKALNKRGQMELALCTETGWFFDMELLTKAERAGLTVQEIAIPWQEDFYPNRESKLNVLKDGIKGILAMIRIRSRLSKKKLFPNSSLITLLSIATVIYCGVFFWHTNAVNTSGLPVESLYYERGDSAGYVQMAQSILNGDDSLLADDESSRGLRTPGYPIFLAGVFTISDSPYLVIILQIIIALVTIPFIYSIGLKLTNAKISFIATLCYIIYPTTAFLNTQILTETLYMFFTSLSLWLLLTLPKHQTINYIAIGTTAGIATLIRPSFIYIIPFIIVYILLNNKWENVWQRIVSAGVVAIAVFIILAPWINANQRDYNHAALSTAGNYNILYVYIPQFIAQETNADIEWIKFHQELIEETREAGYEIGSHQAHNFESEKIQSELAGKKIDYLAFHIKRSVLTFVTSGVKMFNNELTELGRPIFSATPWLIPHIYTNGISLDLIKNNLLSFIDAAFMALVTILIPISVIVGIWRRDNQTLGLILIFCVIIITVLMAGPNGNARYRMPIQPYIFLLAFSSIFIIFQYFKSALILKSKYNLP